MTFLRTLFLVFGIFVFLLPYGVFAQTSVDAVNDTIFIPQNTPDVTIDVLANDTGAIDPTSLAITTAPIKGVAVIDSGNIKYTPTDPTLIGSDTLQYTICETGDSPTCDTATVTIYVAQPVAVDIKPGSCPNPFNLTSKGVLPVAILGTADFDVTTIDPASIRLQGVAPIRSSKEDVATPFIGEITTCEDCAASVPDGYMDLTLKFSTQAIVQAIGVGNVNDGDCLILTLTGTLKDGTPIIGADVLRILKKGKFAPPKPSKSPK